MSKEKHNGTGHYCSECGHINQTSHDELHPWCDPRSTWCDPGKQVDREDRNSRVGVDVRLTLPGANACKTFIPSIAAQQLEQMRIANELRVLNFSARNAYWLLSGVFDDAAARMVASKCDVIESRIRGDK